MDILRTVLIVAAALVVAWVVLKLLAVVTSIIASVFTILVVAAIVYALFWMARGRLRRRFTPQTPQR